MVAVLLVKGSWLKRGIIRNWYEYINCSDTYGDTGKFLEVHNPRKYSIYTKQNTIKMMYFFGSFNNIYLNNY